MKCWPNRRPPGRGGHVLGLRSHGQRKSRDTHDLADLYLFGLTKERLRMFAERQELGSSYFTEIFCFLRLSLASLGSGH
jgi:hypothetical protein